MKCQLPPGEIICERCARKSFQCIFREHRRGRKPGTRSAKSNLSINSYESSLTYYRIAKKKGASDNGNQGVPPTTSYDYISDENGPPAGDSETDRTTAPSSLQPAGLLNREAMRGRFSLQNILSPDHPTSNVTEEPSLIPSEDVITLGLVNLLHAESLFER